MSCSNYEPGSRITYRLGKQGYSQVIMGLTTSRRNQINIFLEFASLIGLLLYSIWSRLWLSIKALVV
jgi:hypothetical protein